MNRFRKAISVGMTASLLASLFTVIAASTALAAVTVTPVGSVPRGGSATGLVYTFTESTAACLPNAPDSLTVTIADSAAGATVSYSGTAAAAGPGSLGTLTASTAANVLTVSWTASDPLNVESITVSGLGISATTTAALGAISATLASAQLACFQPGGTASGTIASGIAIGATSVIVNVATPGCLFAVTGAGAPPAGQLAFAQNAESVNITAVGAGPGVGQQTLTIAATGAVHDAATGVSQTTACPPTGVLASPGTVVDSLIYLAAGSVPLLFPGESNQLAGTLMGAERTTGFLSAGTVLTFTISTAGVTYGGTVPPTITPNVAGLTFGPVSIDATRTMASATVLTVSTALPAVGAPSFTLSNIQYDVASTVPQGTMVNVTLALSGGKVVTPTSRANAQIGRVFTATVSPVPNVNIGQNGQVAGLITITEAAAGSFTSGAGPNNVFEICPAAGSGFAFASPGPIATVTGGVAAGNVILRDGAAASTTNVVAGTPDPGRPGCYYWTVWTASTTASTITIGSSATAGPLINVAAGVAAGPANANLSAGSLAVQTLQVTVAIANRVFANQVQVNALSQPIMAPGATHALAGDIAIQETANGQIKLNSELCVELVPAHVGEVFLTGLTTADMPVATATNGVTVGAVIPSTAACNLDPLPIPPGGSTLIRSFSVIVSQQSTTGNGRVVFSNIHYNVTSDADTGPIQVNVWGLGIAGTLVDFQRVVSNAVIGNPVIGTNATRLGVTQTGAFTISTKVPDVGDYVTYRMDFGVGAAGKLVQIWGATKTGNDWSAFTVITARLANASGVVYYHIRHNSETWRSYRGFYVDGGAWTPARQARWLNQ